MDMRGVCKLLVSNELARRIPEASKENTLDPIARVGTNALTGLVLVAQFPLLPLGGECFDFSLFAPSALLEMSVTGHIVHWQCSFPIDTLYVDQYYSYRDPIGGTD